jgi:hypothetical protein
MRIAEFDKAGAFSMTGHARFETDLAHLVGSALAGPHDIP